MLSIPVLLPVDPYLVNGCLVRLNAFCKHRNGKPGGAIIRFYSIPVAPAIFVIFYIVVKNKDIRHGDLMEITPPGNIGWL